MRHVETSSVLDFKSFRKLSRKFNLIPICREILADLETPVTAFLKTGARLAHSFLLESVEYGEKLGRYSFIGLEPRIIVESREGKLYLKERGASKYIGKASALTDELKKRLHSYRIASPNGLPSFSGGWVGYIGYENVKYFEDVRLRSKKRLALPDAVFFLADRFIMFDHVKRTLKIVVLADTKGNLKKNYNDGIRAIDKILGQLLKSTPYSKLRAEIKGTPKLVSNISRESFEAKVRRIKSYIRAGDVVQAVPSQRFSIGTVKNDFPIYRVLRSINPSPYMFYFAHGKLRLVGSSPELLVKKTGQKAEVRPIAGTRHRGLTEEEDQRLENELRRSKKEMAEHLMLVDLGRNDLGRVCDFKSVSVPEFARVERYSHVMHLVSDVIGKLKKGKDAFDLLKAAFPAGTVTGAPKIRAMEIIDELEPEERGPYAGSLGYFSFSGDMDMCITIRTIVINDGKVFVQAGAGIVNDSDPAFEYKETLHKARALLEAVEKSAAIQ
ncbi:MAG: anthranilate synthase component I [Candidatus Omnitrophica bacterium]|nr:anthranilate synthase component I [Candidatus Omnitrophota bacterium]